MSETKSPLSVFIDESIHPELDFIVSAFVFADAQVIHDAVADALRACGLNPGQDEFKSGRRMAGDELLQELRERVMGIAGSARVKAAVLVIPASERKSLGDELLSHVMQLCRRNGIRTRGLTAHFDQGIFPSIRKAKDVASRYGELHEMTLEFEEDSRQILGIQVADLVAYSVAHIIKQDLSGVSKVVELGEGAGYPEGTETDLGWIFLVSLRYAFLHRPVVFECDRHTMDPQTDPLVLADDEDDVDKEQHPELLGWGFFMSPRLRPEVRACVEKRFARIWLGCLH